MSLWPMPPSLENVWPNPTSIAPLQAHVSDSPASTLGDRSREVWLEAETISVSRASGTPKRMGGLDWPYQWVGFSW
ncbi:hypothetical protein MRB53_019478 [Persea americana]|uniref:Uncharacterized protein n=1 Tax=Persea americana TaxID=3435 RepID=A0ACC2KY27_PERAE|nr:hypothetical protein MRB53_019478 [Persea americana]